MDTLFYSWQDDLPKRTNRNFLKRALEMSLSRIRQDDSIAIKPELDEATRGARGAAHIAKSIFRKIKQCTVYACDVSIIGRINSDISKPTPNPNVLIELGFAARRLGWGRIISIFNTAYGSEIGPAEPKGLLPFDLGFRTMVLYHLPENCTDEERLTQREQVVQKITSLLRGMLTKADSKPAKINLMKLPYLCFHPQGTSGRDFNFQPALDIGSMIIEPKFGIKNSNGERDLRRLTTFRHGESVTCTFNLDSFEFPATAYCEFMLKDRQRYRVEQEIEWLDKKNVPQFKSPIVYVNRRDKWVVVDHKE